MYSVGLDVHMNRSSLEILDERGVSFKHLEIKGSWEKLLEAVDRQVPRPFAVCYEASCGYGALYDQLVTRARGVQVAHPGQLHLIFRAKRKNDRIDSRKLAKLLHLDLVPQVHVPSKEVRSWRGLISFRQKLLQEQTAVKSQVRALLRGLGITSAPKGRKLFTRAGLAWLEQQALPENQQLQRELLLLELQNLQGQRKKVEQRLLQIAQATPRVRQLMSIPGVGIRTAEAVVAWIDDPMRFGKSKQIGSYFGLVPCQDASAEANRLGHITKDGPAAVRWLVCEAAWQGVRRSPRIRAFHDRVMHNDPDRKKLALVATAHYLLRVMLAMLKSGELWHESLPQD